MPAKLLVLAIFFLCTFSAHASDLEGELSTTIESVDGKVIGNLRLRPASGGALINIDIEPGSLPAGYHGMHFHQVASCDHQMGFKSAKGHVDPDKKPHGFLNPKGPHEGNLPNLVVAKDGSVEVELYSSLVNLKDGAANLLDADGSALIIHTNKDDHTSQPIGGSGSRIACAAIKR